MRALFLISIFSFCGLMSAKAGVADVFAYDAEAVYSEFHELIELENYLDAQEIMPSISDLRENYGDLTMKLSFAPERILDMLSEPPLGIPSFLWGFAAGCIGCASMYGSFWIGIGAILFVYFMTDEDKAEAKKAAIGCLVGSLVGAAIWIGVWVAWWGVYSW